MSVMSANEFAIAYDSAKCRVCFTCELICSLTFTKKFNPSESRIRISSRGFGKEKKMSLTDECTECGLCARYCPFGALTLKT